MKKIITIIAAFALSACAHTILVPSLIMPTPPPEIMVPGKPLVQIQKPAIPPTVKP